MNLQPRRTPRIGRVPLKGVYDKAWNALSTWVSQQALMVVARDPSACFSVYQSRG